MKTDSSSRPPRKILSKPLKLTAFSLMAMAGTAHFAAAQSTWNADASDNWSNAARWTGGVPNAIGAVANLQFNITTGTRTVTIDGTSVTRTVGTLRFEDLTTASNDWILAAPAGNFLALDVASGNAQIIVNNRTATISAAIKSGATADPILVSGAGLLVLSGANTFTNTLTLASGATLQLGAAGALGATGAGNETAVSAGATLNINGIAVTAGEIVRIAGFGSGTNGAALLNNGAAQQNALSNVILTADAAVGGSGRFDIRTGTPTLDLAGFRLSKISANQFSLVGANVSSGNIDINAGTVSVETTSQVKGTGSINVANGATLGLYANTTSGSVTRQVVLANGATINELGSSVASILSSPVVLAGNATVAVTTAATSLTMQQGVQQAGGVWGLTKTQLGTLNLGASNFTGPLNVAAGTLALAGGPNSLSTRQVTVADGAVFNPGGAYTVQAGGYLTAGRATAPATDIGSSVILGPGSNLNRGAINAVRTTTINGDLELNGGTLHLDLGAATTSADVIALTGTGNVTLSGTSNIVIRPVAGNYTTTPGFAVGSYTVGTYTGALGGAGSIGIANAGEYRQTFALNTATPGQIKIDVTGAADIVSYIGSGGTDVWDAGITANWFSSFGPDKFYHLDQANFDGSDAAPNVNIKGVVMPASILVDASGIDYSFGGSGTISGPGGLNVAGGTLAVRGEAHDFSGNVSITGGQVNVRTLAGQGAAAGSLGAGTALTLSNGTLNFDGGTTSSSRNMTLGLTAADTGRIKVTDPLSNVTLSGVMNTSAGSLTKTGNGILTLSSTGANFSATNVNVLEGSLKAGNNTVLGTRTVTVSTGATFDANGIIGNATTGGNPVAAGTRPTIEIIGNGMPGQAAFWNGGAATSNQNLAGKIILTGDATFGSPVRYDLNNSIAGVFNADGVIGLTIVGGTNTLTLVGTGEKWWAPNAGATVGKININQGRLGVQSSGNLGDNSFPIVINPAGDLSFFNDQTNGKPIQWNGGMISNTGTGTVGKIMNGGTTLTASSFINSSGNTVANLMVFDHATFTLGGNTLSKIGGANTNGDVQIKNNTAGTGAGNINVYIGSVSALANAKIDGAGVVAVKGGTFNLDDTGGASTLSKTLQLNGGLFQNVTGSHTIGTVVSGGHGRIFNNSGGTTLSLGDITMAAGRGIQFGTTGDVALSTINGAAPAVGKLGAGVTAGPAPATTGFATWTGSVVGVATTTNNNFASATAVDDVLVNAVTTLPAGNQTVNSMIVEQNLTYGAGGQVITLNGGGMIIRANNSTIGTTVANAGKLTSGAADGRLVWNGPETYETRGTADLRANIIDYAISGGGFRPVTLVKNGPGGLTGLGADTANAMLNSTFSGGAVISSGRVVPLGYTALGTGSVTINDGGQLGLFGLTPGTNNLASYLPNNITASGWGSVEAAGNLGAIRFGNNVILSGNLTLADQARLHDQATNNTGIFGVVSGTSGLQKTGTGTVYLANPANTFTGPVEVGFRDLAGGVLAVTKLADGGSNSSLGAGSSAAGNVILNNSTLRYIGNGDSTNRLVTLGQGFNLGATPTSTIEASGYGALNMTSTGNIGFTEGSFRTLQLSATVLNNGANFTNGQLPVNTFSPVLGDPTGATSHGFGQFIKNGPGIWVLTSNQTYSGATTLTDGILRLGNGGTTGSLGVGALGANTVTFQNSADLEINRSNTYNFNHTATGSGTGGDAELVQVGSGTTIIGGVGDNGSLRVRVENGVLELAKDSSTGAHAVALGAIVNGGTLRLGGTGTSITGLSLTSPVGENFVDQLFDGAAAGNAASTVTVNAGTFDLNGRSEAISRLEGNGGVVTNSVAGTVATLNVGSGNVSSFSGAGSTIQDGTGTTALAKIGTGTSVVLANNNFTGGTTIRQGVLQVGSNGTTGSLGTGPIDIQLNGTLAINRSNAFALPSNVSGTGTLIQAGTGTTTVSSPLALTGGVSVNRGTLQVDLSGGNDRLNPATVLTGNGGKISFTGAGTQNLTGQFNIAGSDLESVSSAVVNLPSAWNRFNGGTTNFAASGGGVFNSAIANVNNVIGSAQVAYATLNGTDWAAQTAGVVSAYTGYTANTYAAATHTDVTADFAFGATPATSTLRFNAAGVVDLGLDAQTLTLQQGGVLVTPIVGASLTKISGGTLTGAAALGSEVAVHQHNGSGNLEISAIIANNGTNVTHLSKAGNGTLVLTGANTYSGETHINQGVLQVGSAGTVGTLGAGPVYNDASLAFNRTDSINVDNSIDGSGSVLIKSGTVSLRGANNFTGGLTVSAGTVRTDRGNLLTNLTGVVAQHNNHASPLDGLGGNGFGLGTITLGDASTGPGNVSLLTDAGADIANPIVVSALGSGTVTIGSGSGPSSGINAGFFDGPLVLNRATTLQAVNADRTTFTNTISGNVGTLTIAGGGRVTIENDNIFVGDVVLSGAGTTLQVGTGALAAQKNQIPDASGVTLGAGTTFTLNGDTEVIATLNSTATDSRVGGIAGGPTSLVVTNGGSFDGVLAGNLGTALTLEATGGTLTLGGTVDNNSGRINVNGATVVLAKVSTAAVHAAAVDLTITSGTLRLAGTGTAITAIAGANPVDQIFDGTIVVMNGGTLDLNGRSEGVARLDGYGGRVTNMAAGTTSTINVGIGNLSNLMTAGWSGNINDDLGLVALNKLGNGVAIFTGNLTHTGGTTVAAGGIQMGNGSGTGGTLTGNVVLTNGNSQLIYNVGANTVAAANISGAGELISNGTATTAVTGSNTYTGTTTVNSSGTLNVGNGGATGTLGSGNVTLNEVSVLAFERANALLVPNAIGGTGSVVQKGAGTTTLSGTNLTYTGKTTVTAGTLELSGATTGLSGTSAVDVKGGTLLLSAANTSDRINNTAPVSLGGPSTASTLAATGTITETMGALTLTSGSGVRVIDFGTGAGLLTFASLASDTAGVAVQIWNWSGTVLTGGGTDQLISTGILGANILLSDISFYKDNGLTYAGDTIFVSGTSGELVPIPEAGSVLTALLLLGSAGWRERRKFTRTRNAA